jgi:hypothetical protein
MSLQPIPDIEQLPVVPEAVAKQREYYTTIIANGGFIGFAGGCSLTEERDLIRSEGEQLAALQANMDDLATGQRLNPWKKRSGVKLAPGQPPPYAGLETKSPELAHSIIDEQARAYGSVALEVGLPHHVTYIDRASMIWWGARSEDENLLYTLAHHDPRVLVGVKNPLDGKLQPTLDIVASINEQRQTISEKLGIMVAPAVLIYRGSDNARTPEEWKEERMQAYEATDGVLIDDTAHGSMRAHHPDKSYDKSVEGQEESWNSLIELAEEGYSGIASMTEASGTRSDVDPHMSFELAIKNIRRVYSLKMAARIAVAA